MGYFFPQVMGVGYRHVELALAGSLTLRLVLILAVLKIVATAMCYASGNAGGIFAPSLFIGAMMGASVGSVAHLLMPEHTAGPGAYALVGMGTAFAGVVRAPMTSVLMIFEVTRDYTIIVPLMISNLIAFFISHRLQREPIYEALARQDGVHLPPSGAREGHGRIPVAAAMQPPPEVFPPETAVRVALEGIRNGSLDAWPVADAGGLRGMVATAALERALAGGQGDAPVSSLLDEDLAQHRPDQDFPHLHPDHSLSVALERMGTMRRSVLPVVSRANTRELLGLVKLSDVLRAYGVGE
jgi:CIC family chloride channel protein